MYRLNIYLRIHAWIEGLGNEEQNCSYAYLFFDRETNFSKEEIEQSTYNMRKALSESCNPPISIDEVGIISKEEYEANIDKDECGLNFKMDKQKTVVTKPDKKKIIYLEGAK